MRSALVPLLAAGALVAGACSSGKSKPGPAAGGGSGLTGNDGGGTGGSGATGGVAGSGGTGATGGLAGGGGTGGLAGGGGTGGLAGSGGTGGAPANCGNSVAELGEDCDGTDLAGRSCQKLGYSGGSLGCTGGCKFDTSGCTSSGEICSDGIDNDGDTDVDCDDSDCAASCADSCASPTVVGDPTTVNGNTTGHSAKTDPSCGKPATPTGPEVIYELTAAKTGVLEASLNTSSSLLLSIRTACGNVGTELACSGKGSVKVAATAGTKYYIAVDGVNASDTGPFVLTAESRTISCGDAHRDGNEECDDGNTTPGDGCSASCTIESDETEPNGTTGTANTLVQPFHASISPSGDIDVVKVVVPSAPSSIIVDTFDYGDGACFQQLLDSFVEIIGTDGTTVLASDDDSGAGLCAHAAVSGLAAGTYYVRVQASSAGSIPTFPYLLNVVVDKCGNGTPVETEQCDDGNNVSNDGCSATCTKE